MSGRAVVAYRLFPPPDLTFLLAVDPAVAYDRIETRAYDHEEMSYLTAAAAAYRELPEAGSFVVIDADDTPDRVLASLLREIHSRLADPAPPPKPRRPVRSGTRSLILAVGSLAAGATMLGYQIAEAF